MPRRPLMDGPPGSLCPDGQVARASGQAAETRSSLVSEVKKMACKAYEHEAFVCACCTLRVGPTSPGSSPSGVGPTFLGLLTTCVGPSGSWHPRRVHTGLTAGDAWSVRQLTSLLASKIRSFSRVAQPSTFCRLCRQQVPLHQRARR